MFLTIGLFALIFALGNIDYAVVFSIAPYLNENIVTIVGICFLIGAMAKSAQIGLHVWLPQAMEGERKDKFNKTYSTKIFNKEKLVQQKRVLAPDQKVLDAIVGDLLGDGSINIGNYLRWPGTNGRLEFTFSVSNLAYLNHLKFNVYSSICTSSKPTPWPNILTYRDKTITQYWGAVPRRRLPFLTDLHKRWYRPLSDNSFLKILPENISSTLKPIGLAHWIMGDGYFSEKTVYLSTDNFAKEEVEKLIIVLKEVFNIKATIKIRRNSQGIACYRIRISSLSLKKLRELVVPFFIPEMLYKLDLHY